VDKQIEDDQSESDDSEARSEFEEGNETEILKALWLRKKERE
jgi:hypothetical protein